MDRPAITSVQVWAELRKGRRLYYAWDSVLTPGRVRLAVWRWYCEAAKNAGVKGYRSVKLFRVEITDLR